jgi:NAD(P)-dependent dehydrogenase (short-subunit alcohol dehydrogenase family)
MPRGYERPPGRLQGKVAVITGASRGIGYAIALAFARQGAHVVGASRTPPPAPFPGEFVATDVSNPAAVARLFEQTIALHGGLDVLVNNAAVEHEATVEDTTLEAWDRVLAVNLTGVFLCSKEAIPHLRRRSGGVILNIGSIDGLWAEPGLAAYCASKGGVLALTRSIAIDFGRDGIRCTCICPSYVRTDMLEQYFAAQPDPEAAAASASTMHPVGRIAEPDDVASLAVWLASDEATFASGHPFLLDGGLLAGPPFRPSVG